MPTPSPELEFDFSPEALAEALLGKGGALAPFQEDEDDAAELQAVARRIAGNHVDVIANFARAEFARQAGRPEHDQLLGALSSLSRLAEAAGDTLQHGILQAMSRDVEQRLERFADRRDRNRFLPRLQRFLDDFASCLDGEDADRLHRLVHFEPGTLPLLSELEALHGIGPRRLSRLYCCGLYTVEAVAPADAREVAQVTGLPAQLSADVVEATRRWALERRESAIREIRMRIRELDRMAAVIPGALPEELAEEGRIALTELEQTLQLHSRGLP
ncbi:MAG: hypothetical protein H6737_11080 [Alphaproteobacteria bacterium]|nr:hypothetical protein [Alphaproteobacteria bacterium]